MTTPTNSKKLSAGATTQNSKLDYNKKPVIIAILDHLKAGKTITQNEATLLYGTSRLGAFIHLLRNEGHAIRTDMIEVIAAKGKETEHTARVAQYSLMAGGDSL